MFMRAHSRHSCNSLTLLLIFILHFSFFSCNNDPITEEATWEEARPLKDIYQNQFLMGNIISPSDLNNNATATTRFNYLKRHYNTLTAENHMKPSNIAPSSRPADDNWNYRWTNADNIVKAAQDAGMNVVGHTLIWHEQTPTWLTKDKDGNLLDSDIALSNLKKYVREVAEHFKGKVIAWDVVNEAMKQDNWNSGNAANGNWTTSCLRDSPWYTAIGAEYIEEAFLAARKADPDAKLYYNDYNLNNAAKAQAVYNMVNDINTKYPDVEGRPLIDGIGMQSHHHVNTVPSTVDTSIKLFASLGVEVAISELDIIAAGSLLAGSPSWNEEAADKQAKQYAEMFKIFKNNAANISRVTFWGIDDNSSWRRTSYPTLLDKDYNLKPAFYAVMNPEKY